MWQHIEVRVRPESNDSPTHKIRGRPLLSDTAQLQVLSSDIVELVIIASMPKP
jgi:hypothetical protein